MSKAEIRPIDTPYSVANSQIAETIKHSYQNSEDYPSAPWVDMDRIIGPLLPGMMIVVGARPNQGKTSLLLALFSHLFRARIPTQYCISGDGGPTRLRKILAALHLGFSRKAVLRNRWHEASLSVSADDALKQFWAELDQQNDWADIGIVSDVPVMSREVMREKLKFGIKNNARVVIVDHVNRWTPDQGRDVTRDLSEAVRALATTAATTGQTVILAAQVTPWAKDSRNALTEFSCPPLSALKQTQALVEEPHVVLLLHRARRPEVTAEDLRAAAIGQKQARDLIEPGIMCVTVGKNRDDDTVGSTVRLRIRSDGWIENEYGGTSTATDAPKHEREPGEDDIPF